MFDLSLINLGIILLFLGLGFFLLIWLILRAMPEIQSAGIVSCPPSTSSSIASSEEAMLIVQSGGRIAYLNQQARELFRAWEEEPNLENLARRACPSDTFLTLCADQGHSSFSVNGCLVEGTSFVNAGEIDEGANPINHILVTLRRPFLIMKSPTSTVLMSSGSVTQHPDEQETHKVWKQALVSFAELSQAMTSSLNLESTIQAILESIEKLIQADFLGLAIWDSAKQNLIPYRLLGVPGIDRLLESNSPHYLIGQGYSEYLIKHRKALLIQDVNSFHHVRLSANQEQFPFRSYLGVPLLIAEECIGTLELASSVECLYNENDLEILQPVSKQASLALKNALVHQQELQHSRELSGLVKLANSIGTIRDHQEMYASLIESISPLVEVNILGFLIYDENRHTLFGQVPFIGIPSNVIEWLKTTIRQDSPAESIWHSAEAIVATCAPEDSRIIALELHHFALAAGIREIALVPLTSNGRMIGYLQAANKRDGTPFDPSDLRFLTVLAGQAAPIIENAIMVQQSRHRAQRAECLRRVVSLTSSAVTLDEILKFSILDLAHLLQADVAAVFMLDENQEELRLHKASVFGIPPAISGRLVHFSMNDPRFKLVVTRNMQVYHSDDLGESTDVSPLYQPLMDDLKIHSIINVPLCVRGRGIGELILGNFHANHFTPIDVQTVSSAAEQLAIAIEQSMLSSQTDESLRQRVEQLTALTRISRELNSTLQLEPLLQQVYDEALRTTRADCGSILLLQMDKTEFEEIPGDHQLKDDFSKQRITFHLGDSPTEHLHPLEIQVLQTGEPVVIQDLELSFFPTHPGVRSVMVIPIAFQGEFAGLIHLHAKTPGRFGKAEREIGVALAMQAAIAVGNAHRYQEQKKHSELLNQRVETLSKLFEVSQVLQTEQPLEQSLESIAYAIQAATPFEMVLISVYDIQENHLIRVTGAGIPIAVLEKLRTIPQPWEGIQSLLIHEFRRGRSYFIPYERSSVISPEVHGYTTLPIDTRELHSDSWHPDDILIVPLFSANEEPLGLISVDKPRNKLRPDPSTIETLEIFSSQAALIVESQLKVRQLRARVKKLTDELESTQQLASKAQSQLATLLHKDLEQGLAIQHFNERAQRINAGFGIAEVIRQQNKREDLLSVLGQELLSRMKFDIVLVAEPTKGGLILTNSFGSIPGDVNPNALLGQRNPLRHSLQSGEMLLIADLEESCEWQNTPLLRSLEARSFICLPIRETLYSPNSTLEGVASRNNRTTINPVLAIILAVSKSPVAPFTNDDWQLYQLLGQQVFTALQNLNLVEETSRRLREINLLMEFSRKLDRLDPSGILHALVESTLHAIPSGQAALVALWDDSQGLLIPQAASGYVNNQEIMEIHYHPGEGIPGQVFEERRPFLQDELDFAKHYNLSQENLQHYRNATGGRLPVSSLAVPIMAGAISQSDFDQVKGFDKTEAETKFGEARTIPLGVLVLDNSETTGAFTGKDLAVVTSLAQQTALTLENARLYQVSAQRSGQLQALTGVSAAVTTNLKPEELTATLLDQLQAILPYDTGMLWLREREAPYKPGSGGTDRLVVHAARGFEDSDERIGLSVDVQDSQLLNEMIQTGQPIWVSNVLQDPRFQALFIDENLMGDEHGSSVVPSGFKYLSWLGVPLIASREVIGVIALEKIELNSYSPDDIQVATAFAGQAATSLENARLYQESVQRAMELDQRSQRLTILNRLSSRLTGSLDSTQILDLAIRELAQAISCTHVSALLYEIRDDEYGLSDYGNEAEQDFDMIILQAEFSRVDSPNKAAFEPGAMLPNTPLFDRLRESQSIFVTEDVSRESELAPLGEFLANHDTRSLLAVPIISGGAPDSEVLPEHQFHGMLLIHNSQPYRFDIDEIELARTISNQVAISLQNAHLFQETHNLAEYLETRVEQRTAELAREHQRSETLLRIITELSASLDLEQVLHRTLQVLNEFIDAEQITILISRPGEHKLYRLASIGYTPDPPYQGASTPLDIDQGLAGWIISQRQSTLIDDVLEDERWIKINYGDKDPYPYQHRSALGVPLMSGAEALGCLILFHTKAGHFSLDQLDLVQAAANQVSVAVNNAELYRLIRDQAEDLGSMLRSQQIEMSRSKAILEAVADGVLVTDTNRHITLFNESAEKILGLSRAEVLGKSMEHFAGLFGRATQSWMEMVNKWSKDPIAHRSGDIYTEQILLENGRVIQVQLAPVILHNDFLGTVSSFQDITHQVEVDRLKSEFVATVSHELRTPMTSIKGYVDILLMGVTGELSAQQKSFLEIVKTSAERLSVLVNDLLDISQFDSGRIDLAMQPLNLEDVADLVIDDILRLSEKENKPITIEKDIQPGLPPALGDAERIRQVLENLLENAYKYNTVDGTISIQVHKLDNEIQVDVHDCGVGIHPQDQTRIFERFFRGENTLTLGVSGTGLGLSIAKNLVDMHHGRIWFESPGIPGEGSTFSFTIPVYKPE